MQAMMQRIYREVMIMGLSSFILGIVETANISLGREWDLAYYFADQCAFVTAVFFAFHGLGLMAISVRDSTAWERAGKIDSHRLLVDTQQYYKEHSFIWNHRYFPFCSTRSQVEFRVFRALFSSTYYIGGDSRTFDFAQFLRKYHENNLLTLINLDAWKWFLILAMVAVSALHEHLFRPSCDDDACRYRWALISFTGGGGVLVACALILLYIGRRSEFRLLAKVGVLDASDYEVFLIKEDRVKEMISCVELDRFIIISTIAELKLESAIKNFHKQDGLAQNISVSSGKVLGGSSAGYKESSGDLFCDDEDSSEGTKGRAVVTKKSSLTGNKKKILPKITSTSEEMTKSVSKQNMVEEFSVSGRQQQLYATREATVEEEEKFKAELIGGDEASPLTYTPNKSFEGDSSKEESFCRFSAPDSMQKEQKNTSKVAPEDLSKADSSSFIHSVSSRGNSSNFGIQDDNDKSIGAESQSEAHPQNERRSMRGRMYSLKNLMGRSSSNNGQQDTRTMEASFTSQGEHSASAPSLAGIFRGSSTKKSFSKHKSTDAIASVEGGGGGGELSPRGKLPMHPKLKAKQASARSVFDMLPEETGSQVKSFSRGLSRSLSYVNDMSPAKLRQRTMSNHIRPLGSYEGIPMSARPMSATNRGETPKKEMSREEKLAKRKLKGKLRMGYNDGAEHTTYFKDIFAWKLPLLYYGAIDIVMTANSLYISWWITTFIFIARKLNDPAEGILWIFISLLPAVLTFPILGVVIRTSTVLKSLTELDLDAVAAVVEKTIEIRKYVNLLRGNLRKRIDRLPLAQQDVAVDELFAAVDDTENGELTREDFRRMLVRLQVWRLLFCCTLILS
jgi:hypothetical protein